MRAPRGPAAAAAPQPTPHSTRPAPRARAPRFSRLPGIRDPGRRLSVDRGHFRSVATLDRDPAGPWRPERRDGEGYMYYEKCRKNQARSRRRRRSEARTNHRHPIAGSSHARSALSAGARRGPDGPRRGHLSAVRSRVRKMKVLFSHGHCTAARDRGAGRGTPPRRVTAHAHAHARTHHREALRAHDTVHAYTSLLSRRATRRPLSPRVRRRRVRRRKIRRVTDQHRMDSPRQPPPPL